MTDEMDLWPEFEPPKLTSPKSILNSQASKLTQKTNNLLVGTVTDGHRNDGTLIRFFNIVAPNLNNYKYNLFKLYHDPVFFYPCEIRFGETVFNNIASEGQLLETLKKIFSDDQTLKVINSLLGQSISEKNEKDPW